MMGENSKIRIYNYLIEAKAKININIQAYFLKILISRQYYLIVFFLYLIILGFQLYLLSDRYHDIIIGEIFWSFWLDFILFLFASVLLRKLYFKIIDVENEVIKRLKFYEDEREIPENVIIHAENQLNYIRNEIFDLRHILIFGFLFGFFVCIVVIYLNVLDDYPYLIFHFFFGFNHGMGLLICLKGEKLCKTISKNYVKTVDILDPDGMGGFRKLSRFLVNITIYLITVIILDFFILSCTITSNSENFKLVVAICLFLAILISISLLLISFISIRSALVHHKKEKIEYIGKKYNEIESNFLEKLSSNKEASSDALYLLALNDMYELIKNMKMWPLYETFSKTIPFVIAVIYLIMDKISFNIVDFVTIVSSTAMNMTNSFY